MDGHLHNGTPLTRRGDLPIHHFHPIMDFMPLSQGSTVPCSGSHNNKTAKEIINFQERRWPARVKGGDRERKWRSGEVGLDGDQSLVWGDTLSKRATASSRHLRHHSIDTDNVHNMAGQIRPVLHGFVTLASRLN